MVDRRIVLTHDDYAVLKQLVDTLKRTNKTKIPQFARFVREMDVAIVMESETIPDDVVTMHSRVGFTYVDSKETDHAVLVFPAQTNDAPENVSILSPLGLALIGERRGAELEYVAPGGSYTLRVDTVEHRHAVRTDTLRS